VLGRSILLLAALSGSFAPFQCASEPAPSGVREETPAEALHALAKEFEKSGDREAHVRTLRYIVERYPRSKFAEEASVELRELGQAGAGASSSASAGASASASAKP